MKFRVLSLIAGLVLLSTLAFGQDLPPGVDASSGYTMVTGDEITVKVAGEPQFDYIGTVQEDGQIYPHFVKGAVVAACRTERDLKDDLTKKFGIYLRDPQVSVRVTDRQNRPTVAIYGEVKLPSQVTLKRKVTLRELLAFAGGVSDKSSGMVQVTRTRPALCNEAAIAAWKAQDEGTIIHTRSYSLSSVERGGEQSNPEIFPGDIVVVGKALPVYVIGQVKILKEITIGENGLSLLEAVAQAGGFGERAKSKDIKIRRLKANSREREIIAVNYDLIKKGEQKDIMLQPEDIVEVDKSPKSVAQTVLEIVTGSVKSFSNVLPQTILY